MEQEAGRHAVFDLRRTTGKALHDLLRSEAAKGQALIKRVGIKLE